MRSARKTKASWRSGARPRSAGRKVVQGLLEVQRAEHGSGGRSSPRSVAGFVFGTGAACVQQSTPLASRGSAKRALFVSPQFPGCSHEAPLLAGFPGGRSRGAPAVSGRMWPMELVTGATGYVGIAPAAAPRGGGPARARAGARPERVERAARRGGRARRPARPATGSTRRSTAATPPTTSCTRWRPPRRTGRLRRRDRRMAADASARRRRDAGVERIVYLGGIAPAGAAVARTCARASRSRRSCSTAVPGSTALRASIVIGAGSSSFRVLVRLVERLRRAADAALAHEPHAADRRARRDRVPRPHALGARRPPGARSTSAAPTC